MLAAGREAGNTVVAQAAQEALNANTDQAYREFLNTDQYNALNSDERIKVNQILADTASGPELKAGAQIALDGPDGFVHQFLVAGRYVAAQRDQNTASHNAEVAGYLAQASQSASTASQNANEAQATAARARKAADAAAGYAQQARNDANQAAGYAQQAHSSAAQAEDSARQAAASARTARTAAASAQQSAKNAGRSASWAQASAHQAADFAAQAYDSAARAFKSAQAAGRDYKAALEAANQAFGIATSKVSAEKTKQAFTQGLFCNGYRLSNPELYNECIHLITASEFERSQLMLENGPRCSAFWHEGTPQHDACLWDTLSPSFELDQFLSLATIALNDLNEKILKPLAVLGVGALAGALCAGIEVCALASMAILPEGAAFLPWIELAGMPAASAFGVQRLEALLEDINIEAQVGAANLANAVSKAGGAALPGRFFSTDPLVGDLANGLELAYPGEVVGVNVNAFRADGTLGTDFDISMKHAVIQVKSGSARSALSQARRTAEVTDRKVIVYGPSLGPQMQRNLRAEGFIPVTSRDELIRIYPTIF
ncbi:ALF repeat-containing protein [Amycolatopsis sp. H20-H5]|uniref:ALF repeat-containing protein n=1 Tax=Amycolatopsis sp. H20-H5 TaxID=3046309 RepID=UPI002DBBF4F1|nr:ALF repeat-containing protein [Amycolatopsis sp. H20-H5]MEC3980198.1 ALF repeat-containing protein [Amycolatopsis sp. H20-H5]